jgi:hypothetical protein
VAERQCAEFFGLAGEERIGADHEHARSQLRDGCEDPVKVAFSARM